MKQNKFGELIFSEVDLIDLVMDGNQLDLGKTMLIDDTVNINAAIKYLDVNTAWIDYKPATEDEVSVDVFDQTMQQNWHMPEEYKNLDIAAHVLGLCTRPEQLQRVGEELLLFQERNLFDLLRYLKYLVDVMSTNNVIWGVGRGSSVASYVLFLIGVHKIDSIKYNLDIQEFLK